MLELKDAALLRHHAFVDGQWIHADSGDTLAEIGRAHV